jgi:hypothetical protein
MTKHELQKLAQDVWPGSKVLIENLYPGLRVEVMQEARPHWPWFTMGHKCKQTAYAMAAAALKVAKENP